MREKKEERKDFNWRYQPKKKSFAGVLLDYLDEQSLHPGLTKTEMILTALSAYYLPLAYREGEDNSFESEDVELENMAWDCVFALLRQVDYLCLQLGLERAQAGGLVPTSISSSSSSVSSGLPFKKSQVKGKDLFNLEGVSGLSVTYGEGE